MTDRLTLYVVRNSDGHWFRPYGRGGYDGESCWVERLERAKIYPKLAQARSRVTFFANNYPNYPPPVIVELTATPTREIDETERVSKRLQKMQEREERQKEADRLRDIEYAKRRVQELEREIETLKRRDER